MSGYNGTVAGERGCLEGLCPRGRHYALPSGGYDPNSCACGAVWPCHGAVAPGSDYGNCISIHAEENLLIHARREDLDGGTVYVTRAPCYRCLPRLQAAGVFRVVWRTETDYEAKVLDWGKKP